MSNSIDSRNYGPVPEATLKGRVLARVTTSCSLEITLAFISKYATSFTTAKFIG
jgi:hypothetical protein